MDRYTYLDDLMSSLLMKGFRLSRKVTKPLICIRPFLLQAALKVQTTTMELIIPLQQATFMGQTYDAVLVSAVTQKSCLEPLIERWGVCSDGYIFTLQRVSAVLHQSTLQSSVFEVSNL